MKVIAALKAQLAKAEARTWSGESGCQSRSPLDFSFNAKKMLGTGISILK
jgi:hypothetical protein